MAAYDLTVDAEGYLEDITERVRIEKRGAGAAYTEDGGETWDGPRPAPMFCASNTMPTFLRLKDGKIER